MAAGGGSCVVIDPGSRVLKLGLAAGDAEFAAPSHFRAVVGRSRMHGQWEQGPWYGEAALENRGIATIRYPVEFGIVTNWDDFGNLLGAGLSQALGFRAPLPLEAPEHPQSTRNITVVYALPPIDPMANSEKITQIFMEEFEVERFVPCPSPVLTLLSQGLNTGTVVDLGAGEGSVVPVYEGTVMRDACFRTRLPNAGTLDDALMRHLHKIVGDELVLNSSLREEVVQMKERFCYVRDRRDGTGASQPLPTWKLKESEKEVQLDLEFCRDIPERHWFDAPEDFASMPEQLINCIGRIPDPDLQKAASHVVVSGGCSALPDLPDRFHNEVQASASAGMMPAQGITLHGVSAGHPADAAFHGGCKLSLLSSFGELGISRDEYDEEGPRLVHRAIRGGFNVNELLSTGTAVKAARFKR